MRFLLLAGTALLILAGCLPARTSEPLVVVDKDTVLIPAKQDEKWGYLNRAGQWVIPAQFDSAQDFSDGLALVIKDHVWKYIDKTGKAVIELSYPTAKTFSAESFSEGLAAVRTDEGAGWKTAYIDTTGKTVIEPQRFYGENFSEGLVSVTVDAKVGYIDKTGKIVITPQFAEAGRFREGLARVRIEKTVPWWGMGDRWGYIDKTGALAIPATFNQAGDFEGGMARVHVGGELKEYEVHQPPAWVGGQWWLIDKQGKAISKKPPEDPAAADNKIPEKTK